MKLSIIWAFLPLAFGKPQFDEFGGDVECNVEEKRTQSSKSCQFPFVYKNKTFFGCTTFLDPNKDLWCSTKVDPLTNEHEDKKGHWGVCQDSCPTDEMGQKAVKELTSFQTSNPASLSTRKELPLDISCECVHYSRCAWSNDAIRVIKDLPRMHPTRRVFIETVKKRICNARQKAIYCCGEDEEPPTDSQLLQSSSSTIKDEDKDSGLWKPSGEKRECGIRTITSNIIGGTVAKLGELPFMALLGYDDGQGGLVFLCGGSLINKWYILTAAHCLFPSGPSEVVLGEHVVGQDPDCIGKSRTACAPPVIKRKVTKVIHPDNYDFRKVDSFNDIALIRMDEAVTLFSEDSSRSSAVPICLPWAANDPGRNVKEDDRVLVAGWGRVTNDPSKTDFAQFRVAKRTLQKLVMPVVNNEVCLDFPTIDALDDSQFCGGGVRGEDSCNGDSGGPAIVRDLPDDPWYQVGVVSYGTAVCGIEVPGVYTKVSSFLSWIDENLED